MNEPNDDDLTVLTKEEEAVMFAAFSFAQSFSEYIKEVDPVLWQKGREFAIDCTQIKGITFKDIWKEKDK